jgi:hypothetical protein
MFQLLVCHDKILDGAGSLQGILQSAVVALRSGIEILHQVTATEIMKLKLSTLLDLHVNDVPPPGMCPDQLYLQLEIQGDSVFQRFARTAAQVYGKASESAELHRLSAAISAMASR